MKKITLITFLILASLFSVKAQNNTFLNGYSNGGPIMWYMAEPTDTGYIFTGNLNNKLVWACSDTSANFTKLKTYPVSFSMVTPITGNCVLAANASNDTLMLIKLGPTGTIAWSNKYVCPFFNNWSPEHTAVFHHSGNICLTGSASDTTKKNDHFHGFIMETDSMGNLIKGNYLSVDTLGAYPVPSAGNISITSDNTCYLAMPVTIQFNSGGFTDFIKMDSLLNIHWVHSAAFGNDGPMLIRGNSIITATASQFYDETSGYTYYNTFVSKYDTSGNLFKTADVETTLFSFPHIVAAKDGGEVVSEGSPGPWGGGLVIKLDTGLNVQWSNMYELSSTDNEVIQSLMPTTDGGFLTTTTCTWGPSNSYVAKIDSNGSGVCYGKHYVTLDSVSGPQPFTKASVLYRPLSITQHTVTYTESTLADTVLSYCYGGILSNNDLLTQPVPQVSVYPNPSNGIFNYELKITNSESVNAEVYNMLGEKVYSSIANSYELMANGKMEINLSTQPAGIYLYRITDESGKMVSSGKLVIK